MSNTYHLSTGYRIGVWPSMAPPLGSPPIMTTEVQCPLFEWNCSQTCAYVSFNSMGLMEIAEHSTWLSPSVPQFWLKIVSAVGPPAITYHQSCWKVTSVVYGKTHLTKTNQTEGGTGKNTDEYRIYGNTGGWKNWAMRLLHEDIV